MISPSEKLRHSELSEEPAGCSTCRRCMWVLGVPLGCSRISLSFFCSGHRLWRTSSSSPIRRRVAAQLRPMSAKSKILSHSERSPRSEEPLFNLRVSPKPVEAALRRLLGFNSAPLNQFPSFPSSLFPFTTIQKTHVIPSEARNPLFLSSSRVLGAPHAAVACGLLGYSFSYATPSRSHNP
jgi:hypothetical protein